MYLAVFSLIIMTTFLYHVNIKSFFRKTHLVVSKIVVRIKYQFDIRSELISSLSKYVGSFDGRTDEMDILLCQRSMSFIFINNLTVLH